MASNASTLADENGSFEDWIEIQNNSPVTVNLLDWSLTDNDENLTKWRFPATNLPPGQFLVVFASDKNRRTPGAPLHTNFKLGADGEYLALVDPSGTNIVTQFTPQFPGQVQNVSYGFAVVTSNETLVATGATARVLVPSAGNGGSALNFTWTGAATNEPFNTASWTSGQTGVGFGASDVGLNVQASMLNNNASAFIRLPFVLNNPTNISLLTLRMKYDDGFVAWINGVEIARGNAPEEDLAWNSLATAVHAATTFETMSLGVPTNVLRSGTNILAIQGLNVTASDSSFLILPELIGTTVAGESTSGLYFTQPTPGAENLGGATVPGPGIATVTHTPNVPLDSDNLVVTARVFTTANPIASVTLYYRVMFGVETPLTMFDDGAHGDGAAGDGVYGATIPASASTSGQMVRYYVRALDNVGYTSRLPVFTDPASTAEYLGTVVNPNYVTSALPVVHLFAPNTVLQPGPTTTQTGADSNAGGRVSLFYDGEFYDNVLMFLRGNTTAGYNKKSHRLEFNREHPFRHNEPGGRIRKTSFVADYPDPTYMRQGLGYWLCTEIGAAGPFYAPYRLQLNGQFYQLANHNDVHTEELLERLGYDPNGALYNAAGTIQPNQFSTGGFEKKTRRWEGNTDYVELANAISESLTVGQRRTNIFDRLDLPQVISYMVAARFFHENDDAWANMSVYHDNDGDNLWRIIPFDINLSWGAAYMDSAEYSGIQVTNDNIKSFPLYGSSQAIPGSGGGNWNRLYDVVFSVPQTREMFVRRMRTMLDEYVKPPGTIATNSPIYQKVVQWRDKIAVEAALDRAWWGWPGKGGQCNFDPGINLANGVNGLLNDFLNNRRNHFYGKHSVTNTALPIGIHKSTNAGIPLAQPTNATLSVVAWDYNPASGNQDQEYVQLTNANSFALDISEWELTGGIYFKFQQGTVVPANSSINVSPNVRTFRARTTGPRGGQGLFVVGPYDGHLNAWGETLVIADAAGRSVSTNSFVGSPSLAQRYLRITEIMYNPSPLTSITNDAQQFEYIELKNISTNTSISLMGVRFTNGIFFNFTGSAVTSLLPGQTVLLVRNQAVFAARYGGGFSIAGQFTGALNNGGEALRLEDAAGEKILEFDYNNSWYPITDGLGFSLVIVDANASWDTWGQKASWRASGSLNGSPGVTDPLFPAFAPIIVNEVLTHTDLPQLDSVELFNPTATNVNIGGWFLTDDFYAPKKYRLTNGMTIPAGGYLVLNENQFTVGPNAFRFNEHGEWAYLFAGDANTNLTGYVHGYEFGEAPNGVSFGRYTNSQGDVQLVLQSAVTLGAINAYPRVGPIVISEIMYRPPDTNGAGNDLDEFIELQNITATNVPLYFVGAATNTWRLRNAVDFDFPTNQVLAAGSRVLVVGFSPTNAAQLTSFRAKYGVSNNVPVYGPWSGELNNAGETIELKQPDQPDSATGFVPFIMMDKIAYRDETPWPAGADGIGNSLQRVNSVGFGNDPTNWFAAGTSVGRATVPNTAPVVSILSPSPGSIINSSNVTVSVEASDAGGAVALVQLLANDVVIAQWTATSSNHVWTGVSSGTHTLKARVTDNLGAIGVSSNVTITVVAPPPVVAITSPTHGAILISGTAVNLAANAVSGGGYAESVNYFLDGNLIGTVGAPFTLPWTANPAGYHTISAVGYDAQGQTSTVAAVTVFVQAVAANPVLIPATTTWRYLDNGVDQGTGWIQPSFADAAWPTGLAKFGFNNSGNSGIATVLSYGPNSANKYPTYYFRRQFVVSSLAGMTNLLLEVQRDDGAAVYLNGVEIYRNNLLAGATYSQLATNSSDNGNTWLTTTLPLTGLLTGTNVVAAEVHQSSLSSSDSAFDLRLTLLGYNLGPALLSQPTNVSVATGGNATFAVVTTGSAPLTYRWYFNNVLQASATNSLVVANAQAVNAGSYYVVVSNAVGVVTSSVATLTLAVSDADGDGMPDAWESANGTNPGVNDANADLDGDGMSNLREYWAGTSPTNAASALRFDAVLLSGNNLVFNFTAVSNRGYTVQSQSVVGSGWQKWQDINPAVSNRSLWLTNAVANTNRLYRLVTPLQP